VRTPRLLVCLFAILAAGRLFAAEPEVSAALDAVEKALRPLIEKLDPKPEVTRSNEGQKLEVAYKAQIYKVHGRLKSGEFSKETRDELGPSYEGFILRAHVQDAGWVNPLATPQTIRQPYWQTDLDVTRLAGTQKQIFWSLSYIGEPHRTLLIQIRANVGAFGQARRLEELISVGKR
jgi:hypothetical protein